MTDQNGVSSPEGLPPTYFCPGCVAGVGCLFPVQCGSTPMVAAFEVPIPSPAPEGISPADPELSELWGVSPTQVDTWDSCERKWAWKYIGKAETPQNASAALGSRVHNLLETYLLHGTLPDQSTREGEIATAGLHLLPEPPIARAERTIGFYSPNGYRFTGKVDYEYPPVPEPDLEFQYWWTIGDHKTTSDFKWAKTEEILREDPQALVYAAASLLETGDDCVNLEWTYYRTRGSAQARQVSLTMTAEHVAERFPRLEKIAEKIHLALATVTDPLTLSANTDTCEKYGGCPYQHLCNISLAERWQSHMSNMPPVPPPFPQAPAPVAQAPAAAPAAPLAPLAPDTAALMARLQAAAAAPAPAPAPMSVLEQLRANQAAAAGQAPQAPAPVYSPPPAAPQAPAPVYSPPPVVQAPVPQAPPPMAPPAPVVQAPPVYAAPTPAAGTWYAAADNSPIYPCACGHQGTAPEITAAGGKCPRCQTPVPGASIFCEGIQAAINPPEGSLPPPVPAPVAPAPVQAPAPTPTAPAALPPTPTAPKAGPGRPAGSKNAPKAAAGSSPEFQVTWAKEKISPRAYNDLEIGPFAASGSIQEGETLTQAMSRVYAELAAFAEAERARKIASYLAALPPAT